MATFSKKMITRLGVVLLGILMLFQGMTSSLYSIAFPININQGITATDPTDPFDRSDSPSTEIPENGDAESEEENSEKSDLKLRRLFEPGFHLSFSYLDKQSNPPMNLETSVYLKKTTPPPEV